MNIDQNTILQIYIQNMRVTEPEKQTALTEYTCPAADYQAPNLSDGPVRVSMAPAMIPMVTIDDQEWETSSLPAYLIRETFACFNAAYPIPVGEFVNEIGRSENDFSDKRFLEYLVRKDYVRKAMTIRDTYYWIHDEEAFQTLRDRIESLLAGLEKETGK